MNKVYVTNPKVNILYKKGTRNRYHCMAFVFFIILS